MKEEPGTPDPLAEDTLESRLAYTGQFLRVYEDAARVAADARNWIPGGSAI